MTKKSQKRFTYSIGYFKREKKSYRVKKVGLISASKKLHTNSDDNNNTTNNKSSTTLALNSYTQALLLFCFIKKLMDQPTNHRNINLSALFCLCLFIYHTICTLFLNSAILSQYFFFLSLICKSNKKKSVFLFDCWIAAAAAKKRRRE